jgi:hypothetical protein
MSRCMMEAHSLCRARGCSSGFSDPDSAAYDDDAEDDEDLNCLQKDIGAASPNKRRRSFSILLEAATAV